MNFIFCFFFLIIFANFHIFLKIIPLSGVYCEVMRWQPYFSYGVPVVEVMQSKISFLFKEFFVCEKKIVLFIFISVKKGLDVTVRSSHPEVFLWKGVLKICRKFTGEQPCRSAISITLQSNFIEIALRHGCSPVNLLHIFRTPFPRNTSGWLLLNSS